MFEKIKQYAGMILTGLTTVFALLFLWERSKRRSAEAVADNKEMLDKVNELDSRKAHNDGNLASEEDKREDIKKDVADDQTNTDADAAFFNKRNN